MLTHFTSKGFVVYETYNFNYGVNVSILGIFNTQKKADAAIVEQLKKYKKNDEYYRGNPFLQIAEISVNEVSMPFTEICNHSE